MDVAFKVERGVRDRVEEMIRLDLVELDRNGRVRDW